MSENTDPKPNAIVRTVGSLFDSQKRMSWRRLAVWATGTGIFLLTTKIGADHWLALSGIYIGGDALEKVGKWLGSSGGE